MLRFKVDGMICGHCAQTVTIAVEALPSVERASVDGTTGVVSSEGNADESAVRKAIEDAGYDVSDCRLMPSGTKGASSPAPACDAPHRISEGDVAQSSRCHAA
ncbi:heavy-metal-associated domain-containing protein [Azospirillum agricola]|uniref:heavy-metal-associated domain-containing protein n=1 Tax=Azospirillum agricola TaxID=1720247 RepID=UPI000A0F3AD6|nr:heavy-metal-associated domain-containing protein [Azospirillum agricola]SMH61518.1 Copper chaperone CopZ [Azospirillum lipoferum]